MRLTADGRFLEAAAALETVTSFAEICTRACPSDHLCEESCLLNGISEPVAIRALEQFLVDYALAHGQADTSTAPPNGMKIAVVGSGPGGLACAEELARRGCAVTVFDSAPVAGGLLVDAIPSFKMDHAIFQRRLDLLKKRGIVFRLGARLWEELTISELRSAFDALFLALDGRKERQLEVPGANLKGVLRGTEFLRRANPGRSNDMPPLEVRGKRVVVLGGDDMALDCLRAAIRLGAGEAIGVWGSSQEHMPCGRKEYEAAVQEGVRFLFAATPVELVGGADGSVKSLRWTRTALGEPASPGGRRSVDSAPEQFEVEAELAVLALGFEPSPCPATEDFRELSANAWGGLAVNENLMTSVPGVFAGGDLVHGPVSLIEAVRDGRSAAEKIAIYLAERHPTAQL